MVFRLIATGLILFSSLAYSKGTLITNIEKLSDGQWTVEYVSHQPIRSISFAITPDGSRSERWSFVSEGFQLQRLNQSDVVMRNDIWAGPTLTQKLIKQYISGQGSSNGSIDEQDESEDYQLTSRERGVLDILLKGASNKEIARQLDITERTVKAHVTSILQKTATKDRLSLILKLTQQTA